MSQSMNNSMIEEALKIILINKSKAKSLRISLINDADSDNPFILKIRRYLGEFEYDLKLLYDIINELNSLYYNDQNNLNDSITNDQDKSHISNNTDSRASIQNFKKNNSFKMLSRYKKHLNLKDLDENEDSQLGNKKGNKTYSLTINICDDRHNYNSKQRKKYGKKINKSNSCKAFIRRNNLKKFDFLKDENINKIIPNSYRIKNKKHQHYLGNNFLNNFDIEDYLYNHKESSKENRLNNNHNHYTYMTDYSSNDRNNKPNLLNSNINKNRISLKNLNNICEHYNSLLNNGKNQFINNNQIPNENNLENHINDILTFRNSNNFQSNSIPKLDLENIQNNNYNERDRLNYNLNNERNTYEINYSNNFNKNDYINIKNNEESERQNILRNNYLKRNEIVSNLNNNIENNKNDIFEENKRNEIIQNIISILLQDTNKLNELKKYFGEEIGEKLLKGEVSQENLFKIVDILKAYQKNLKMNKNEKNLFRGSKKNYTHFRNKLDDNILLKESLNNNGYFNKEYPIGFLSRKDYFQINE